MMNHNDSNHSYTVMFFIMIISGLLTTMNVWVDSISDVRFSINDLYCTVLNPSLYAPMFKIFGDIFVQKMCRIRIRVITNSVPTKLFRSGSVSTED